MKKFGKLLLFLFFNFVVIFLAFETLPKIIRREFNLPKISESINDSESVLLPKQITLDNFPKGWKFDIFMVSQDQYKEDLINVFGIESLDIYVSGRYLKYDFSIYQDISRFNKDFDINTKRAETIAENFVDTDEQNSSWLLNENNGGDQISVYCKSENFDTSENQRTFCGIYKVEQDVFEQIIFVSDEDIPDSTLEIIINDIMSARYNK